MPEDFLDFVEGHSHYGVESKVLWQCRGQVLLSRLMLHLLFRKNYADLVIIL